jgi:hypothetical protein
VWRGERGSIRIARSLHHVRNSVELLDGSKFAPTSGALRLPSITPMSWTNCAQSGLLFIRLYVLQARKTYSVRQDRASSKDEGKIVRRRS